MKNVLYLMCIIILISIIIINIFSILNIPIWGFRIYKVGSGSMEPILKVDDLIIVKDVEEYKINDVITYKSNEQFVTHRIVEFDENIVITKGDANKINDTPILKEDIIGKVIYKFRLLNSINYMLSKVITWILIFVIGVVSIIYITYSKPKCKH